ncbi:MAG: hypothetical protein RLY67_403 [Pseudomonadota bacterium]|jgi:hypothetical protein
MMSASALSVLGLNPVWTQRAVTRRPLRIVLDASIRDSAAHRVVSAMVDHVFMGRETVRHWSDEEVASGSGLCLRIRLVGEGAPPLASGDEKVVWIPDQTAFRQGVSRRRVWEDLVAMRNSMMEG